MNIVKTLKYASLGLLTVSLAIAGDAMAAQSSGVHDSKHETKANRDKSGFAVGLSYASIGGKVGDMLGSIGAKTGVPEIDLSYTTRSGFLFGLTSSLLNSETGEACTTGSYFCDSYDFDYGTGSAYAGYETEMGVRLMAGYSFMYANGTYDNYTGNTTIGGVSFGAGYAFNNGVMIKAMYAPSIKSSDDDQLRGSLLSASLAYKF